MAIIGASSSPMASACATDTKSSIAIDWFIRCSPPRCHQGSQGIRSLCYSIACSACKDKRGVCRRGSHSRAGRYVKASECVLKAFVVGKPGACFLQLGGQLQQAILAAMGGAELDAYR